MGLPPRTSDPHDGAPNATPSAGAPRGMWTGLGLCSGAAALSLSLAAHRVPWFPGDLVITRAIQAADLHVLGLPLRALNALGFPPVVDVLYGVVVLGLFVFGRRMEAAAGSFAALGGAIVNHLVKQAVDRPRPSALLVHVEHHIASPSYPAGHVLNFTAFAGFLCCLAWLRMAPSPRRSSLVAFLLTSIALMGLARIDSGEHWPSDVLGGYLLGALWLSATVLFYEWGRRSFAEARRPVADTRERHRPVAALLALSLTTLAVPAHATPEYPDSLGATSEVPWNPQHPLARRRGWEQAVLLPGRIVSLPLSGLGWASENVLLHLEQNPRYSGLLAPKGNNGTPFVRLRTARMGDRTGLGAAIGVHEDVLHGAFASRIAAEYAATLHSYNRTLVNWSGSPLSLQYGYEWRPQERFYGTGNGSSKDSASDYAGQREFVRGALAWDSNRERDPARPRSVLGIWGGPRSTASRTGREGGTLSYQARFPALGDATLNRSFDHLVYGASLLADHRGGSPHWAHGWRTLLSAERFDVPVQALELHSGGERGAQFTRYQAEAEAGVSFMRSPRTLRALVRVADQQAGSDRDRMAISDLSTLGGEAGLGGYEPGRFHDMDLLLTRLQYVFPLQRRLEMELHSEWGGVYPDLWSDAKLNTLHQSAGFSLRLLNTRTSGGSIGFDFSHEAVRLRFSLGGLE